MSEHRRGARVVLNEDLPGVPEGTLGICGRGLGFATKRYRVRFDNGVEAVSVAHSKLVPEAQWPQFLAKRARAEIEAAQERARRAEARAAAAELGALPAPATAELTAGPTADSDAAAAPASQSNQPVGETITPAAPQPSLERVEVPEFVPGPEVDPDYTPAANRISELLEQVRNSS